jgi:hypothetical protein
MDHTGWNRSHLYWIDFQRIWLNVNPINFALAHIFLSIFILVHDSFSAFLSALRFLSFFFFLFFFLVPFLFFYFFRKYFWQRNCFLFFLLWRCVLLFDIITFQYFLASLKSKFKFFFLSLMTILPFFPHFRVISSLSLFPANYWW